MNTATSKDTTIERLVLRWPVKIRREIGAWLGSAICGHAGGLSKPAARRWRYLLKKLNGSATGYKSACELAADNPNPSEYLAQLEKTVTDLNRIDEWARKIWGSVCLLGPEDQDRLAQIIDACEKWRQSPNETGQARVKGGKVKLCQE